MIPLEYLDEMNWSTPARRRALKAGRALTRPAALVDSYRYHRGHERPPLTLPGRPAAAILALALARRDVAAGTKRYPSAIYPAVSWQPRDESFGHRGERLGHVADLSKAGLREVGRVDTDPRGSVWDTHGSGFITDPYGDCSKDGWGLCWPMVYQLPGRKGLARFVAGYIYGGCSDDTPTIDFGTIFEESTRSGDSYNTDPKDMDAAREAASYASGLAEHAAEQERDYQAAWAAGSRYADLGRDVVQARRDLLVMLQERREALKLHKENRAAGDGMHWVGPPGPLDSLTAVCAAIKRDATRTLEKIRKARAEREQLKEGSHEPLYFYSGDARLAAAFEEGQH